MKLFRFDSAGKEVSKFGSLNSYYTLLSREITVTVGCMHLKEDSVLGMHPAVCPQLFLIVSGEGWVRSADGKRIAVDPGTAIFWEDGEEHESGSALGMTAVIIEGPGLEPSSQLQPL
ncbi:cupin domain-containing protein [Bacillus infantis]|uniref:cupin domain-containing protein n=1 Tax=Bacillus infantis TaxID=324767 RepID=UPI003CF3574E